MLGSPGMTNQSVATYVDGHASGRHSRHFPGHIWYVDGTDGDDGNTGEYPHYAFATVGAALGVVAEGDAISIRAGDYDEAGLDLAVDSVALWCEEGVFLRDTAAGTVLTISADRCIVEMARIVPSAGQTGLHVTGGQTFLSFVRINPGGAVGFDMDGSGYFMEYCRAGQPTTTGYDLTGSGGELHYCYTGGAGGATRGYYLTGSATRLRLFGCVSINHGTAGYHITAGSVSCVLKDCVTGTGDGTRIDAGDGCFWPGFVSMRRREQHEHIYPISAGQGVAGDPITVNNSTTDGAGPPPGLRSDQNYWGDIKRVVPPDTLTADWHSLGIYIHSGNAGHIQQWQIFFTDAGCSSAQNVGNDWDTNEVALTVTNGSIFEADDLVWVTGNDKPEGEIQKVVSSVANVVTVVRETTADGQAGLRYVYDVDDSANRLYLVYRPADREFHAYDGDYETATARDAARFLWSVYKYVFANGAMLMRMLNATNANDSEFDVRAIYQD